MLASVQTVAYVGAECQQVAVEVDVHNSGLPSWNMVGLLETAVKEAKERVASAIRNCGYKLANRKTIVNLTPANVKKSGVHFDLPIAIGMLTAWGVCQPAPDKKYLVAGELSLSGELRSIPGVLLMALTARELKFDGLIVPLENAHEASLVEGIAICGFKTLVEVVEFLNGERSIPQIEKHETKQIQAIKLDLSEVRGQRLAKRALEIAAAGRHHLLMVGTPGSGKTMLAERLPSLLPPLNPQEKLESLKLMSLTHPLKAHELAGDERPFRAPHHTASYAGLVGGGAGLPRLGELALAHHGVLFLDELAEFRRDCLEVLREPLESGQVQVVRASYNFKYPAHFQLVAAHNPCPCGWLGHPKKPCICSTQQISRYRQKISGPLADRIDLHVEVQPVEFQELASSKTEESSEAVRKRILQARHLQTARFNKLRCNGEMRPQDVQKHCSLSSSLEKILEQAAEKFSLSARSIHRILKVSRTIADLANAENIAENHLKEALLFRPQEKTF